MVSYRQTSRTGEGDHGELEFIHSSLPFGQERGRFSQPKHLMQKHKHRFNLGSVSE